MRASSASSSAPGAALMWQKALKKEAVCRQAGHHQSRQHGGWTGHRRYLDADLQGFLHQLEPRVRHQRRACVRNQRQRRSRFQSCNQMRAHHPGVMFVIGDERRRNAVMRQKEASDAGVLRNDCIGSGQGRQCAEGDVFQIADRGRHDVQTGRDGLGLSPQTKGGVVRRRL